MRLGWTRLGSPLALLSSTSVSIVFAFAIGSATGFTHGVVCGKRSDSNESVGQCRVPMECETTGSGCSLWSCRYGGRIGCWVVDG